MSATERIQQGLTHRKTWVRHGTMVALCAAVALPVGAVLGLLGAMYGTAFLLACVAAYWVLQHPLNGLIAVISIVCLLPFAALPIDIGFSPTFLDLALAAVFFVWVSRVATHREGAFQGDSPTMAVFAFMLLAVVSFIAGLSHAPLTANVIRHFGEILLGIAMFSLVINIVRTRRQLELVLTILMLAGFAAALIGMFLYFVPDTLAIRLLSVLRIVRYPSGAGVLRYIEDDPELPLRAISTSVDPNVLGGMLIFVTTPAVAQMFSKRPILPRRLLIAMTAIMGLCLILTFSRGSFVGLAAALGLMGLLRYPRMLWVGLGVIAVMLVLPQTQDYVQHFMEGIQGQDLATQMRFGEYKDALILIRRYPWFGVGFAGTPDVDTYLGVSNVYLLIAEEMGVIGLGAFLIALFVFIGRSFGALSRCRRGSDLEPILLGTSLAIVGGMMGGMLDHYLFNLVFPHASALLWMTVGLGTVAIRLVHQEQSSETLA